MCFAGVLSEVLPGRKVITALLFAVAAAYMVGKVAIGVNVDITFKYVVMVALRAAMAAAAATIGPKNETVVVHN